MKCSNCESKIEEGDGFCQNCGHSIVAFSTTPTSVPPIIRKTFYRIDLETLKQKIVETQKEKGYGSKTFWFLMGIGLLIYIILFFGSSKIPFFGLLGMAIGGLTISRLVAYIFSIIRKEKSEKQQKITWAIAFLIASIITFIINVPNYIPPTTPTTQKVATKGTGLDLSDIFCNGYYWKKCETGQSLICPTNGKSDAYCDSPPTPVSKNNQQDEIDAFKSQIESLETPPPIKKDPTTAQIIAEWSPRVVFVRCFWKNADTGQLYRTVMGSGTLFNFDTIGFNILTNKHVLADEEEYRPTYCGILFLSAGKDFIVERENIHFATKEYSQDIGWITLLSEDPFFSKFTPKNPKICDLSDVGIGDDILVLGYPAIGSQRSITATKGIISGIDGNYYLTDAKIDHGNSGGAAILTKSDCYFGIPTSSMVGEIESIGRILRWGVLQ
ncbi:hypothetical protein A3I82_01580 [Candidatus Azambacteria bacterium RIFCSPLOWO2_02_FULL_42_10]|nr:MAG: hypothetical protein A3I82_01580 [Candidatus Azambacteria bacterium RIFCSPLOWO2_02_FULL_42_10]